ncbi:hypothetical protein [Marinoscillum sp. MHG1-6]|uniref:hypothetical protein n=1 Tax=Marinoscillum sp. MHG1-6 TaxID=2959627 RepID=UPI0021573424|nr:hypothetical protein [Marinoscillum sp. MHG1-6]
MIKFFRKNDPYRLIWIFLILVAIRLIWTIPGMPMSLQTLKFLLLGERLGDGWIMYKETFDYTAPLSAMIYKWLNVIFGAGYWVHVVFSSFLVIIQAGILNSILLKNKVYDENGYLPAFLYVILMSSCTDFFVLSPELMSLTFIILSLNQIFRRIDNIATDELFLYAGIYIGLATAFYLPAIIYFIIFLFSLVIFTSAILRRLLLFVYGFAMIFLIIAAYYFWFGAIDDFWSSFVVAGFNKPKDFLLSYGELLEFSYVLLAVLVLSLTVFVTSRFTNFQVNVMRVMMLFLIAAGASLLISREITGSSLVFFIAPMAYFLAYYLMGLRRWIFKLVIPTLILFSLLAYPYYLLQGSDQEYFVETQEIDQPGEPVRLMILGEDLTRYEGSKISGPFIDGYIGQQRLEGLDYYQQASQLYDVLSRSNAEMIIDEWNKIPLIFERFPDLEEQYKKVSADTYVKINS